MAAAAATAAAAAAVAVAVAVVVVGAPEENIFRNENQEELSRLLAF